MKSTKDESMPLAVPIPYSKPSLELLELVKLPKAVVPTLNFDRMLKTRRSGDCFLPVSLTQLSDWLYFTCGTQTRNTFDKNRARSFVASMGSLHPNEIVLIPPNNECHLYLRDEHSLAKIAVPQEASADIRNWAKECHAAPEATLVVLVCNLDLVDSYYNDAEGLVLRDSGVLLGHASLVAAGCELAFRCLGRHGDDLVRRCFTVLPFRKQGTGLAWIGKPC